MSGAVGIRRRVGRLAALVLTIVLMISGCQVTGQASPNPSAMAELSNGMPTISGTTSSRPSPASSSPPGTSAVPSTPAGPSGAILIIATDDLYISQLLATMWSQALVDKGYKVGIRIFDDISDQLAAVKSGKASIGLFYNAELLGELDASSPASDRIRIDEALADLEPGGVRILTSAVADDRTVLVTSKTSAAKHRLSSLDDLARLEPASITLATTSESDAGDFLTDELEYAYGVTVGKTVSADFGGPKMLAALRNGTALLGAVSNCQPVLDTEPLVVLADPEQMMSALNPVPVVHTEVEPAAEAVLEAISGKLTTQAVRGMLLKLDNSGSSITQVTRNWLISQGLG